MADAGLRGREREALIGGIDERRRLERERCRIGRHVYTLVKMLTIEQAGQPYPVMRIRVCCCCLEPVADWKPGEIPCCSDCGSPVRVRKSGYCAECIIETSTQRRTPTGRRRFLIGRGRVGKQTHIVSRHLEAERVLVSLCGARVADRLPNEDMPTCKRCNSARVQAHLREKDTAEWEGRGS